MLQLVAWHAPANGGTASDAVRWLRQGRNVGKLLPRGGATAPQYVAANKRAVEVVTPEMMAKRMAEAVAAGRAVKARGGGEGGLTNAENRSTRIQEARVFFVFIFAHHSFFLLCSRRKKNTTKTHQPTFACAWSCAATWEAANASKTPAEAPSGILIKAFPIIPDEEVAEALGNMKSLRGSAQDHTQVQGLAFVPVIEENAVPVWGVMTMVMHPETLETPGLESDVEFMVRGLGRTVARLRSKEMEAAKMVIESSNTALEKTNRGADDIEALRRQAGDIYKVLNTSVAKANLQELPRYRTAKRVTIGTALTARSILGDKPAWGLLLEPPAWRALQVPAGGERGAGGGEEDSRVNVVLSDAPNTLSVMWTFLRPKIRITARSCARENIPSS